MLTCQTENLSPSAEKNADMIFLSEWLPSSGGKFRSRGQEKQEPGKFWRNTPKKIDRPEPSYGGGQAGLLHPPGGVWGSPGERTFLK
jgi:hypothetical protein